MFDWNDLKAFLAVARGGSTLAAAKAMAVNQTTVARRLENLEQALNLKLFERGQSGSRLTEAGRDLLEEAEKVERAAATLASRAGAHRRGLTGVIKLTATEVVANSLITPALGAFRRLHPDVNIDLMVTDALVDIAGGQADLAVRSGMAALEVSDLLARKIADHDFALYCSRDYAALRGIPASPAALRDHDLIGGDAAAGELPGMAWLHAQAGGKEPASRSNSMTNLMHAVRAGLGIAPLPCMLADADPRLVQCSEPIAEAQAHTWIVLRREMKDVPRIRAFIDFLAPAMQQAQREREARNRSLREANAANDATSVGPAAFSSPA